MADSQRAVGPAGVAGGVCEPDRRLTWPSGSDVGIDMFWQAGKFLMAVVLVLLLAWLAERVHPRLAGLFGGFPLGTALALLFIGMELAPEVAAEAAGHALSGLAVALLLMSGYALAARGQGLGSVLVALACGLLVWLAAAAPLALLAPGLLAGLLLVVAVALAAHLLLRSIPEQPVRPTRRTVWQVVAFRALIAGGLVLLITWLAHRVPASWSGIMAAFPMTFLPGVMLIHLVWGAGPARTMIRHYPAGIGALVVYVLAVSWAYGTLGLAAGTLVGLSAALVWLAAVVRIGQISAREMQK